MGGGGSKELQPVTEYSMDIGKQKDAKIHAFVGLESNISFDLQQKIQAQLRKSGCTDFTTANMFGNFGECVEPPTIVLLSKQPSLESAASGNFWMFWTSCKSKSFRVIYNMCLPNYANRAEFARRAFPDALNDIYGTSDPIIASTNDSAIASGLSAAGFVKKGTGWVRGGGFFTSQPKIARKEIVPPTPRKPESTSKAKTKPRAPKRPSMHTCQAVRLSRRCPKGGPKGKRANKRFPFTVPLMRKYIQTSGIPRSEIRKAFPHGISGANRAMFNAYFRKHPRRCQRLIDYSKRVCI